MALQLLYSNRATPVHGDHLKIAVGHGGPEAAQWVLEVVPRSEVPRLAVSQPCVCIEFCFADQYRLFMCPSLSGWVHSSHLGQWTATGPRPPEICSCDDGAPMPVWLITLAQIGWLRLC